MLSYRFVLFYNNVEEKYASLLLIYVYSTRKKIIIIAFLGKGKMRFKKPNLSCYTQY